jgi:hypothetical protein
VPARPSSCCYADGVPLPPDAIAGSLACPAHGNSHRQPCEAPQATPRSLRAALQAQVAYREGAAEGAVNSAAEVAPPPGVGACLPSFAPPRADVAFEVAVTAEPHPVTGRPCAVLHPCTTAARMADVTASLGQGRLAPLAYMLAWLSGALPVAGMGVSPAFAAACLQGEVG